MQTILGVPLVPASVPGSATYGGAADVLASSGQTGIAVVDESGKVLGLFGPEQALRGCLPRYLDELRHTAFAHNDIGLLADLATKVRDEPVDRHMAKPVTVDRGTSAIHLGEVFLHCGLPAIAVTEKDVFVGMLDRAAFTRAMLARGS